MSKDDQTQPAREATASPEHVVVAITEIAGAVEEGLLALAVATGFQGMTTMMDADVTAICGPKGRHNEERTAVRHGSEYGSVTSGRRGAGAPAPGAKRREQH